MALQDFGSTFELQKLFKARNIARDIAYELASLFRPGMTEEDAHKLYKEVCTKYPVEKQWHPAKLRFGPNTLKDFKETSIPYVLQEEDIFFVDIGPVIEGHEADYGETFTIGDIYEQKLISDMSKKIFHEVAEHWNTLRPTGEELYQFAQERAEYYGYYLSMGSDGHRIGDFPHHIHYKGGMPDIQEGIVPNAWILEIHLFNPERTFGAFYEDILTDEIMD
jgi:methionine aminopeptidase